MELFEGLGTVPPEFGPSAVTIGKFDGVHLGHRSVIAQLVAQADAHDLTSVAVTFDRHPMALLNPEACPSPLVSNAQRAELLAQTGVDVTVVLEFTRQLSALEPAEFVDAVLVRALNAQLVLAGRDFRFGHRGSGDITTLRELGRQAGFEVVELDDVDRDGDRVSSSRIRSLIDAGAVREAAELLGRPPQVRSTVVRGDQIGREIGFPTANLDPTMEGLLPADGVYAARAAIDGVSYGAAVSIGNNPTFEGVPDRRTEAHLLDYSGDIYGETIELDFIDRIRSMKKYDSVDDLVVALAADVVRVRDILAGE
ncbi:MAG: bifunctional riboflavin kinase/FAD synthetase [Pseudolysinimonas sp.]|uniref:bifunctional riboflavin kinase/FAD synthetase n=1 Tax=Pseudolysinimonas sp. TaxID=2680009 RepID=UPI003267E199